MKDFKHGDILPENLRDLFPEDVYNLIIQISRQGFGLTLVGGAVRDYLLGCELSHDLDFELRHSFDYPEEEWKKMILRLSETLKNKYSYHVEVLPFEILKIKQGSFDLELSSPRLETYSGKPPFGHSEFEVELSPNLSYEDSFKRRDFTVNAIGIEFGVPGSSDEFKVIDPLDGLSGLKNKTLKPCSEDFYDDPVRFLRMVRFSERFDFSFEGDITKFDLTELSAHYFFQESLKDFFVISRKFFELVKKSKIKLAIDLHELAFLRHQNFGSFGYLFKDQILMILTFGENEITMEDRQHFVRLAGMKSSSAEDFEAFSKYLNKLKHLTDVRITNKLRHSDFVTLLDDEELVDMKILHQIFNRHRFGTLDKLELINPESHASFTFFKNLFGKETKGKALAGKLMGMVKEKEKRSVITIYCHLLAHYNLKPVMPESRFGS